MKILSFLSLKAAFMPSVNKLEFFFYFAIYIYIYQAHNVVLKSIFYFPCLARTQWREKRSVGRQVNGENPLLDNLINPRATT